MADPEKGPWGPLTPPFEVNFRRLNDSSYSYLSVFVAIVI